LSKKKILYIFFFSMKKYIFLTISYTQLKDFEMKNNYIFMNILYKQEFNYKEYTTKEITSKITINFLNRSQLINNLLKLGYNNIYSPFVKVPSIRLLNYNLTPNASILVFDDTEEGLVSFVQYINSICLSQKCLNVEFVGSDTSIIYYLDFFKQYFNRNFSKPKVILNTNLTIDFLKSNKINPDYVRINSDNSIYNKNFELISKE